MKQTSLSGGTLLLVILVTAACASASQRARHSQRFHPQPYSVRCVQGAFAVVGLQLYDLFPQGASVTGMVVLQPLDGPSSVKITVMGDASEAEQIMVAAVRAIKVLGKADPTIRTYRVQNLFVRYRRNPRDADFVRRALHRIHAKC